MRFFATMLSVAVLFGFSVPAECDQTDNRLDGLFARLGEITAPAEAARTEQQIWAIWLETSNKPAAKWLQAGVNHMASGAHEEALAAFDDVVELAPDFAEGWNKRATVNYLLGNYKASLSDIEKTLQLEPRHFGALSGRGLVYVQLDDLDRALASFEAALKVNPHLSSARAGVEAIRQVLKQREI